MSTVIIYKYNIHRTNFSSCFKYQMPWDKTFLKTSLTDTFWKGENQPGPVGKYPLIAWRIWPVDLQYNPSPKQLLSLACHRGTKPLFPLEYPKPQKCNTWSRRMECWEFISFSNSTLVEFRSIPGIFGLVWKCSSILQKNPRQTGLSLRKRPHHLCFDMASEQAMEKWSLGN